MLDGDEALGFRRPARNPGFCGDASVVWPELGSGDEEAIRGVSMRLCIDRGVPGELTMDPTGFREMDRRLEPAAESK